MGGGNGNGNDGDGVVIPVHHAASSIEGVSAVTLDKLLSDYKGDPTKLAINIVTSVTLLTQTLRFSLTRGHCWGVPTPLEGRGGRRTPSVSSRFGSKLPLPRHADMRLHIPLTRHTGAGRRQ